MLRYRPMSLLLGLTLLAATAAAGDKPSNTPVAPGGPTLKTALEKGLFARRPLEFAYIARVVEAVDDGTLPKPLVETCFLYAKRKRPYPFPYFQQTLELRAHRLGINF